MNALSNGIKIEVDGKTYHTLHDWGFALGNNNYISDPELETFYVNVPYRDAMVDLSTALTKRRVFKKRELSFSLGGIRPRMNWDSVISDIRNKIHGKECKIILDNDRDHYWLGRVYVVDFDRTRDLGTFTLSVPQAEPYKYNLDTVGEPWEWDPFNFETGITHDKGEISINGTETVTIPAGMMPIVPIFVVTDSINLTVTQNGKTYALKDGSNRIPSLFVNGEETELEYNGIGKVVITYRGGSL